MTLVVKRDVDGIKRLRQRVKYLENTSIETGWFKDKIYDGSGRGPGRGVREVGYNAGVHVAEVAYTNDEGSFDVPARNFMHTFILSIIKDKESISNLIVQALTKQVPRAADALGKRMKQRLQEIIETMSFYDHNSPATIARKGFDDVLEDTGVMLDSVDYRVKGKAGASNKT